MHGRVYSEGQGTESRIFFGLLKFIIFIWVLEILDIFWVNGRCWARAYLCRKMRVPPTPGGVCPSVQTYPC